MLSRREQWSVAERSGWASALEELTQESTAGRLHSTIGRYRYESIAQTVSRSVGRTWEGTGKSVGGEKWTVWTLGSQAPTSTWVRGTEESHFAAQGVVEQVPARADSGPTNSNGSRE